MISKKIILFLSQGEYQPNITLLSTVNEVTTNEGKRNPNGGGKLTSSFSTLARCSGSSELNRRLIPSKQGEKVLESIKESTKRKKKKKRKG